MTKCCVEPYEGEQAYIFFSYCHEDALLVYPIIEKLSSEGFRIWFDDGIHPGEEWPDVIATHLNKAKVCIAAISTASAESHNCRNEVSFAVANKKPLLSIVLQDFQMPLGMQLQLGNSNYIRLYEQSSEAFYERLFASPVLLNCRDNNEAEREAIYDKASELKEKKAYLEAARLFEQLGDYKNADVLAKECRRLAEGITEKEAIYNKASELKEKKAYLKAARLFEQLGEYKDADVLAKECRRLAEKDKKKSFRTAVFVGGTLLLVVLIVVGVKHIEKYWIHLPTPTSAVTSTPTPTPASTPTPTPAPSPTLMQKPGATDLDAINADIVYPRKESYYLDSYETKYVKSPSGKDAVYSYKDPMTKNGVNRAGNYFTVYNGTKAIVLARAGDYSCVIFPELDCAGWIKSDYLVS